MKFLFIPLFLFPFFAQAQSEVVRDPVSFIMKEGLDLVDDPNDLTIYKIEEDLNNDGFVDQMLGAICGNAGCVFHLFFGLKGGDYKYEGIFFSPTWFNLTPLSPGKTMVRGCGHMGACQCQPYGYYWENYERREFTASELPSGTYPNCEGDSLNKDNPYLKGNIKRETYCKYIQWKKDSKCEWK